MANLPANTTQKAQPAIRFEGYSGEWTELSIGTVVNEENRPVTLLDNKTYQLVTVKRRNEGVIPREKLKGKNILVKNYKKVEQGDFLISKRQIIHGSCGVVPQSLNGAIVSNEYMVISDSENMKANFWNLLSKRPQMYKKYLISSFGVDIEKMVFSVPDWKNKTVNFPNPKEQTAIGNFFQQLDDSLALHKRKHQQTQQLKKAMLGKLFPQKGQSQPEIRLQGFSGNWEEKRLGDVAKISRGLTYSPKDIVTKGVRVLRSSNINEDRFYTRKDDVFVCESAIYIPLVEDLDILITSANGSTKLVGKHAIVEKDNISSVHGGFMLLAKTKIPFFLQASMCSEWYFSFINSKVAGGNGAIGNLSKSDLENVNFLLPKSPKEQTAIGNFFKQLDDTLALQAEQIRTLENLKTAFLQQMFV